MKALSYLAVGVGSLLVGAAGANALRDAGPTSPTTHGEWVYVKKGADSIRAYVAYPERKDKAPGNDPEDPGNPSVDFHGEKRSNQTHESTTDPDARLARKGNGKEAKLSYCGNVLMENRHGLIADVELLEATGIAERGTRKNRPVSSTVADKPAMNTSRLPYLRASGVDPTTPMIVAPRPKTLKRLNRSSRPR